jgi:AraC-like DNA-binding protein
MSVPVPPARHLLRAKDLVDARYREPLDVPALARAAHLSPAHFSREFRRAFGETPHQYLLTRRLERAAALLRNTDRNVAFVCASVGLQSVGSFTTSFGRAYGLSPTAYREAHPPAATRARIPTCVQQAYARPHSSSFREDPTRSPRYRRDTFDAKETDHVEARHRAGVGPRPGRSARVLHREARLRGA